MALFYTDSRCNKSTVNIEVDGRSFIFQINFMFLGQTKFVLGPGWPAKKKKEKMNVIIISNYTKNTSKWFVLVVIFTIICGCLTVTLSIASHFRSLIDYM